MEVVLDLGLEHKTPAPKPPRANTEKGTTQGISIRNRVPSYYFLIELAISLNGMEAKYFAGRTATGYM